MTTLPSKKMFKLMYALGFLSAGSFVHAASNPISVESLEARDSNRQSLQGATSEVAFQAPIEALVEAPIEAPIEGNARVDANAGEMHYQMQLLQQEVQQLRGMVEELKYALGQMKTTQDDRYLELDNRFQNLNSAGKEELPETQNNQGFSNAAQDEKSIYESAIKLIRGRQYDLAIEQLKGLIAQYPDGSLAPNAYYWLGEVYAAKPTPEYENARKALAQVITFFPEHRKVPDAAFKLGKVYHLMGDCVRARELLQQVISEQSGKSVSKLAEAYLRDKVVGCQ